MDELDQRRVGIRVEEVDDPHTGGGQLHHGVVLEEGHKKVDPEGLLRSLLDLVDDREQRLGG